MVRPFRQDGQSKQPEDDDERRRRTTDRPVGRLLRVPPGGFQNLRRRQPHDERQAERDQQKVVEMADERDEVGNEIDGAERVGGDENRQGANENRGAGIAGGEIDD